MKHFFIKIYNYINNIFHTDKQEYDIIYKERMLAIKYIENTKLYLDYLEEHLFNVYRAFYDVSVACDDMAWVVDDYTWFKIRQDVFNHDVSKFSKEEFVAYRQNFYPVDNEEIDKEDFKYAWKHHLLRNNHHWESLESDDDVVHMIIDWTAMGYKFGNTAQEYYETNKDKINIDEKYENFMYEIFNRIEKMNKNGKNR